MKRYTRSAREIDDGPVLRWRDVFLDGHPTKEELTEAFAELRSRGKKWIPVTRMLADLIDVAPKEKDGRRP